MFKSSELSFLSSTYGDAFFVFDQDLFDANLSAFRDSFASRYNGHVALGYSFKTNYTPVVCSRVLHFGGYAEVVSSLEYQHAVKLGFPSERIIFNGPWKATDFFEASLLAGSLVNIDNDFDVSRLSAICDHNPDRLFRCCIRLNPSDSSTISRFGFDVNSPSFGHVLSRLESIPNLLVTGIHIHLPFRSLDSFRARSNFLVEIYTQLAARFPLQVCNIGGGFMGLLPDKLSTDLGIPQVTFQEYASLICSILNAGFEKSSLPYPTLFFEPGTALVSNTFSFFTKVLTTKSVSTKNFALVAGSIFDISPNARFQNLPVVIHNRLDHQALSMPIDYEVCGFTCIESDVLTPIIHGSINSGDYLEYLNVGSYSIVMRPPFILPSFPIVSKSGDLFTLVRRQQVYDDLFASFVFP